MDLGVKEKAYIIVGGTRGMGWAAAQCMAADGAHLAIVGRDAVNTHEKAKELSKRFDTRVRGYTADVTKTSEIETAINQAIEDLGPVCGLLTTPGTTEHNGTLLDMSDEDWQMNFDQVFMSQVRSCRAILPHLIEQGGGTLVITSAYSARAAKPFLFGYASQKAALINFTKNLCKTYGDKGIRANCVCPGAIETDTLAKKRVEAAEEYGLPLEEALEHVMFEEWKMPVAMRSVGKPQDVGELMAFLLSDRAAYMTGAIVNIDGGSDF